MGDSSQSDDAKNEQQIEVWKIKKLIKSLEAARGNGTSMISLILPPKDQISRAAKMLADEFGTASNIKSRVNRLSVLSAITSTQQRLKLFTKVTHPNPKPNPKPNPSPKPNPDPEPHPNCNLGQSSRTA